MMETNEQDTTTPAAGPAPDAVRVKATAVVQVTPDHSGAIIVKVKGFDPITFNPMKASLANRRMAEFVGWKNRLIDAAAVSADTETGKTSPADKHANILALVEYYETGVDAWARKRTEGGEGAKRESAAIHLVIPAMLALGKARDVDHANGLVDALAKKKEVKRDDALKLLLATSDVGKKVAELKAAQKTYKEDADSLLEGL